MMMLFIVFVSFSFSFIEKPGPFSFGLVVNATTFVHDYLGIKPFSRE